MHGGTNLAPARSVRRPARFTRRRCRPRPAESTISVSAYGTPIDCIVVFLSLLSIKSSGEENSKPFQFRGRKYEFKDHAVGERRRRVSPTRVVTPVWSK